MQYFRQFHRLPRAVGLCLVLALVPGAALAQDTQEGEDPVVARVNGEEIRLSEVRAYASTLPPQYQLAFDQIFPFMVQRMVDLELLDGAAEAADLSGDEEFKRRMKILRVRVMRELYLERVLADDVSDEAVRAEYETYLQENPPAEEVHARHILLESEEEARAVIAELDQGGDFVTLAEERSTGPSSAQGGDLGYFSAEQMVPSFSEVAFALEPGSYTAEPVQTQFGWHVILVEDRRTQSQPAFEEVEAELRENLEAAAVKRHIEGLREGADVEIIPYEPAAGDGASEGEAGGESME